MEEFDIKQQLHLLHQEVEAAVSLQEDTKLNLLATIDALKIEVEVLNRFLTHSQADFSRRYPELHEEVMQQIDPEWIPPAKRQEGK